MPWYLAGYPPRMEILFVLLLVAGAICFGLAASGTTWPRPNFIALGLLFWILVPLIQHVRAL